MKKIVLVCLVFILSGCQSAKTYFIDKSDHEQRMSDHYHVIEKISENMDPTPYYEPVWKRTPPIWYFYSPEKR